MYPPTAASPVVQRRWKIKYERQSSILVDETVSWSASFATGSVFSKTYLEKYFEYPDILFENQLSFAPELYVDFISDNGADGVVV